MSGIRIPYLARLYTECIRQSNFSRTWKEGKLVVLLKSEEKDRRNPKSYHPICLLKMLGKIFERILVEGLEKCRNMENYQVQFGFRKEKGTEDFINLVLSAVQEQETESRYVGLL